MSDADDLSLATTKIPGWRTPRATRRGPAGKVRALAILKQDHMGLILRAEFQAPAGGPGIQAVIVRDFARARWWALPVAYVLAVRERRVLRRLEGIEDVPQLVATGRGFSVRSWIEGRTFAEARPDHGATYTAALRLLRTIHRRGVTHDDTHKEANWLVTDTGRPALIDFQLAIFHRRRGRFFRTCALEDQRHLLKHKRRHCGHALLPSERRVLARRSWIARAWMRGVKPLYLFVTRRILGTRDGEGRGHAATKTDA